VSTGRCQTTFGPDGFDELNMCGLREQCPVLAAIRAGTAGSKKDRLARGVLRECSGTCGLRFHETCLVGVPHKRVCAEGGSVGSWPERGDTCYCGCMESESESEGESRSGSESEGESGAGASSGTKRKRSVSTKSATEPQTRVCLADIPPLPSHEKAPGASKNLRM